MQAPFDVASNQLLKEQIEAVLSTINPREKRVIQLRFGLEDGRYRTLEEVGKEFNVTRERIRQSNPRHSGNCVIRAAAGSFAIILSNYLSLCHFTVKYNKLNRNSILSKSIRRSSGYPNINGDIVAV